MSIIDVNFDSQELDKNTQIILEAATTTEASFLRQGYKIILETAKNFNVKYLNMISEIDTYEILLKKTIKSWESFKRDAGDSYRSTLEYDEYRRNRQEIKEKYFSNKIKENILETYSLALKFQEYLNAALNQKVATVYVWTGAAGVPETYVLYDMTDFLKVDTDRYGNVIVRYRNNSRMLKQHAEKVESSIRDHDDFNYAALKRAYSQVSNRYNTYKVRGGSFVLWLYPYAGQKWNGVLISSFGSVNQAYATILLHEHFNPTLIPEDDIEQFMSYVLGVTNLSGTLEGDTTIGMMELVIKSKNATTLSIQQIYKISQDIINGKLNNFEAIRNYLTKLKKENAEVQSPINRSLKGALQNIVDNNVGKIISDFQKS